MRRLNRNGQTLSTTISTDNEVRSSSPLSISCDGEAMFEYLEDLSGCDTSSRFTIAPEFLLILFVNEEISDGNA
jgi:hypothetical protein